MSSPTSPSISKEPINLLRCIGLFLLYRLYTCTVFHSVDEVVGELYAVNTMLASACSLTLMLVYVREGIDDVEFVSDFATFVTGVLFGATKGEIV